MPVGERSNEMDTDQSNSEEALEAAVFRRLLAHMDERKDVQNIELMNLAGFCRNCLSKWYVAAAEERGGDVDYESAREIVYGMAYSDWKKQYQTDAKPQQMAQFEEEKQQS